MKLFLTLRMWTLLRENQFIPKFGVHIRKSLQDSNPDIIAKLQFPETPPKTYQTPVVNLTLSHAKLGQSSSVG